MEQITTLAGKVVDKLGQGLLSVIVMAALFLGAGVYAFQIYADSQVVDVAPGKTINATQGGSQTSTGDSTQTNTANFN
jgi:hypothetical protein